MEHEPLRPLSASQRDLLEEATSTYQAAATAEALVWLSERGIGPELADTYRLGVVADPLPGHERFRGYLAIPYLGHDGRVLSLRFRCIQQHEHRDYGHGKYMSVKDEPTRMFSVAAVHQAQDVIHVAEGEFDAILLNALGMPAVGVPGANNWLPRHRRMLAGFSRIWVWADPDDAGAELGNRITRSLRSARAVRLRGGDVTESYMDGGAAALRHLIEVS